MVISKDVHANVNGKPFASADAYSHSSFLRKMQELSEAKKVARGPAEKWMRQRSLQSVYTGDVAV